MEMDLVIHSDYNCYSSGFPPGPNSFNLNNPGINSLTLGVKSLIENTCGSTENNGYSFLHFNSFVIPDYVLGDTITLQIDQALNYNIYTCFQDLYNSGYFDGCFEAVLWQINNSYNVLGTVNNPEITISDNLIYVDTNCPTVVNNTDLSIDSFSYDIIGCDVGSPYASMNITVLNEGNTIINEFCMTLDILPDNLPSVQYCFDNLSILPGESYVVEVNGSPLSNGVTSISITTPNDNGFSNNSFVGIIDLPCYGCTWTSAINYDPYATVDDGSCVMAILGCTDPQGLNYNPFATVDDGSCIYLVLGCTDPQANNYNPNADVDDNSCTYDVLGCTDPQANNYNPNANIDNGSCTYDVLGCTDPQANNYNPNANIDNGSCTYDVLGCTDPQANNYNPNANVDNGSCTYDILGCTDPQANNFNPNANIDNGSCTYDVLGCTDPQANNYNPNANVDNGSCTYDILGCTDVTAFNYNPNANVDDNSCEYEGCTNPQALNYDPNATLEDGTCIFPPTIDDCDDVNVFIPNAFTPNNDGVNDSWYIVTNNDCWLEWSLTIYNRWGGLIWESNDPNDVWIGNVNGGDYYVADGLYVYRIIAKGERGRVYSNSGNITVLR
jgi:gliding motility-associated-like protein